MPRPRSRLNWIYDDTRQEFTTPTGRVISLHEIARLLYDQIICHHDFAGPWAGWRMRGDRLIPPGHITRKRCINPRQAKAILQHEDLDPPAPKPRTKVRLYLAYSRT